MERVMWYVDDMREKKKKRMLNKRMKFRDVQM